MKLILSIALISFSFLASANSNATLDLNSTTSIETVMYPGGPGKKKARRNKRINKKRKRKCGKWGRRSFAG